MRGLPPEVSSRRWGELGLSPLIGRLEELMIRALTQNEMAGDAFRHLLWLAVEVDDSELDRILVDELARLTVLGEAAEDRVIAFVAFDAGATPVAIEYLAVDEASRGAGLGAALVARVRSDARGRDVYAQTDDDAVEFYRRTGFEISGCERDPRWPDRQRYDCVLRA